MKFNKLLAILKKHEEEYKNYEVKASVIVDGKEQYLPIDTVGFPIVCHGEKRPPVIFRTT